MSRTKIGGGELKPDEPAKKRLSIGYWGMMVFMLVYLAAMFACLRQWKSPEPWARLDRFSGGFILLSLGWMAATMRFHHAIFRSKELMQEASGMSYDPGLLRWITVFSLGELTVFLDYGHWHLIPALAIPALQWLGLLLNVLGALLLFWGDTYLTRHFANRQAAQQVIDEGPYRSIRHPRYLALIISRVSFALAFGSALGWLFVGGWIVVILRRIRLEEAHVRELFGAKYIAYSERTARLIPGIY